MEAEFEVQRTIKRAYLTPFLCLLNRVTGTIKVHVDTRQELKMGYGKEKETASNRELEMLIFGPRSGKNCTVLPRGILWWKCSMSRRTAQRRIRKRCRSRGERRCMDLCSMQPACTVW